MQSDILSARAQSHAKTTNANVNLNGHPRLPYIGHVCMVLLQASLSYNIRLVITLVPPELFVPYYTVGEV